MLSVWPWACSQVKYPKDFSACTDAGNLICCTAALLAGGSHLQLLTNCMLELACSDDKTANKQLDCRLSYVSKRCQEPSRDSEIAAACQILHLNE